MMFICALAHHVSVVIFCHSDSYLVCEFPKKSKGVSGSMEFCHLRPEGPIARVGLLGSGSRAEPQLLTDFFCQLAPCFSHSAGCEY